MATLIDIPKDVQLIIFNYLDDYSKTLLHRTCRHFKYRHVLRCCKPNFMEVLNAASEAEDLVSFEYFLQDLLNFSTESKLDLLREIVSEDNYGKLKIWKQYITMDDGRIICERVKFKGEIWKNLEYFFISSYKSIADCLYEWSSEEKQHMEWIMNHGVTPGFLTEAFHLQDEDVYTSIIFDVKLFQMHFSFSKRQIDILQNHAYDNYDSGDLEKVVLAYEYVSPYVCEKSKAEDGHNGFIEEWCDCSYKIRRKKLKL